MLEGRLMQKLCMGVEVKHVPMQPAMKQYQCWKCPRREAKIQLGLSLVCFVVQSRSDDCNGSPMIVE